MKTLLFGLLLGLAYMELAQSLRCYTCKEPTDISLCKTETLCPMKAKACTTTLLSVDSGYPFFGNITVIRSCAENCTASGGIGANRPMSCCYTDLCNDDSSNSSPGLKTSYAALSVTALVLVMLFKPAL
ncbi:secreted Ly-6/uPAR-related protein 1-like [Dromaius novaehollandiae]|uniref:secreted Ly-6/uPAR-related protein 1-like n=1 Tax=Dromaius novaehollandiae TaxID=8790 RepID=UPI000E1EF6EC|nr:secreted Ly-6/uPAR-related protein 1-like [Dromaius novaehollandiae]